MRSNKRFIIVNREECGKVTFSFLITLIPLTLFFSFICSKKLSLDLNIALEVFEYFFLFNGMLLKQMSLVRRNFFFLREKTIYWAYFEASSIAPPLQ